ncbi:MAG: ATP-binding protein [Phycisphaeraceae bacterium]|nr:MAG: ATP-binding protein [Phycisphaeraceae bacterium]
MPITPTTSLLDSIVTGRRPKPRRVMLFGTHGVGKSTFGAMAEAPIFIPCEDGLADIDCASFPLCHSVADVIGCMEAIYNGGHSFKTVVIDSLDWLERLIWAEVCNDQQVPNIESIGYAKGYSFALDHWRRILRGLDALRDERGMTIVLIAHAKVEKFENPETEPYDRYSPRLHKLASGLIQEWCDEVLFATYRVHVRKTGESFNKARYKGIGTGERIIRTTERPAHVAKNRLNLPDEIPLDYRVYAAFVRGERPDVEARTDAGTADEPAPANTSTS